MKIFTELGVLGVVIVAATGMGSGNFAWAAQPPPVRYPQACAPNFCIEVIPQWPHSRYEITTRSNLEDQSSTLIVKLKGGVSIAFHSKYVNSTGSIHEIVIPRWHYDSNIGSASACFTCRSVEGGKVQVIGIAVAPVPGEFGRNISGLMSVCYWPFNRQDAGYGSGRMMSLGEKVCVDDAGKDELPDAWPVNLTLPSGTKIMRTTTNSIGDKIQMTVAGEFAGDFKTAYAKFKSQLKNSGYKVIADQFNDIAYRSTARSQMDMKAVSGTTTVMATLIEGGGTGSDHWINIHVDALNGPRPSNGDKEQKAKKRKMGSGKVENGARVN